MNEEWDMFFKCSSYKQSQEACEILCEYENMHVHVLVQKQQQISRMHWEPMMSTTGLDDGKSTKAVIIYAQSSDVYAEHLCV